MDNWQLLSIVGLVLVVAELFTGGFVMLPIGIAFLLTAGAALLTDDWTVLFGALAVSTVVVFTVFRRFVKPRLQEKSIATGADAMIGKEAIVTEAIRPDDGGGYVKLYGDTWKAVSRDARTYEVGQKVIIHSMDGNKVVVDAS